MKKIVKIPEKRKRILKKDAASIRKVEELMEVKVEIGDDVSIDGESFNVFQVEQVIKAFGRGFDMKDSMDVLDDDYGLEIINLPDVVKSDNRMLVVKGRIIGTNGKTKKAIEEFTETKVAVQGKTVSILGKLGKIGVSKEAIMMLVHGSSHKTLYRWLEKKSGVKEW
jgi:ribosomal RNA assembly protein